MSEGRQRDKNRNGLTRVSSGVGRLGLGAGRLVLRPTRGVAGDMLEPVAEAAVDRALAGPLPEAVARSLVEHHVIERVVREVLASADFDTAVSAALDDATAERMVERVLASPRTEKLLGEALESKLPAQLADRMVRSPEFEHLMAQVMSSPAVRTAITAQTETIGDEMIESLRATTTGLDTRLERGPRRLFRRPPRAEVAEGRPSAPYGGFATRGAGLALDILLAHILYLTGAAMVALLASLAGGIHPSGSSTRSPQSAGPRCRSPTSSASGPPRAEPRACTSWAFDSTARMDGRPACFGRSCVSSASGSRSRSRSSGFFPPSSTIAAERSRISWREPRSLYDEHALAKAAIQSAKPAPSTA